ncbi:hypothetical protein ZIOFF_027212 [Zingiber officinale]|uniref:DUF4283 domain-containing protein n=1 Tax=Zingiber officinale TaxID=94328 RepID=A0A8J5LL29_ZINOF|nr:hypothetical protein ZIOFF_027212 [Zingiber officinale]
MVVQVFRKLGLSSFYNVRFLRSGYVFMHLTSSEDMTCVWTRGVWFIGGVPLRAFKWSPHFSYSVESFVVPVWVQLPDLPIQMFNKESLFSATSIIRKPIKIDEATADCSRLSVAWVCVEIDLLKPKVEDFWIGIDCYANGKKPKPMWKYARTDANVDNEDLREIIYGRRNEKGKESTDVPKEILPGVVNTTEGVNQVWMQKKVNVNGMEEGFKEDNAVDGISVSSDDSEQDIYKQKASESICSGHVEEMARGIGELNDSVVEASTSSWTGAKLPRGEMRVANQKLADSNAAPQIGVVEVSENQNVSRMVDVTNMSVVDPVKYRVVGLDRLVSCQLNQVPNLSKQGRAFSSSASQKELQGVDMSKYVVDEDDPDYVDTGQLQRSSSLALEPSKVVNEAIHQNVSSSNVLMGASQHITRSKAKVQKQKLQFKLKHLKGYLKWWNSDVFGNIHDKDQAHLLKTLNMEEIFGKQKAVIRWIAEGDRNTKFFHNLVQKRRLAARISRIWENGVCLEKLELIQASGAEFFERLLSGEEDNLFSADLEHIPSVIISEENLGLLSPPTMEEVKHVVWEVGEDSATRSDGFSVAFYVACWEIIILDVYNVVLDFFQGGSFPKGMAATTIVLIPIKDNVQQWQDFSPISLCNASNKIISKLLANRFREQNTPWVNFLTKLYCGAISPVIVSLKGNASPCWRRMIKIRSIVENQIGWTVGGGRVRFWYDEWLDRGLLFKPCVLAGNPDALVSDFIEEQDWNLNKVRVVLPFSVAEEVADVAMRGGDTDMIWKLSSDGKFSMKSRGIVLGVFGSRW